MRLAKVPDFFSIYLLAWVRAPGYTIAIYDGQYLWRRIFLNVFWRSSGDALRAL